MYIYGVRAQRKKDCVARLGVINDTFSGRIIFITTNSWLCTLAHILRVADKGRCYAARPWRINLLIKAIPLTPTGATTHLIRHRESNSGRPYGGLRLLFVTICIAHFDISRKFLVEHLSCLSTTQAGYNRVLNNLLSRVIELESLQRCFCID